MKISKLFGKRLKDNPKNTDTISQLFLVKGGYIKMISTGIYSYLPLAKIIISKIEKIIRNEMNSIDGQEIFMPIVSPSTLWKKTNRYEMNDELLKFNDRNNKEMVLNMTHEEVVCYLMKYTLNSYKQLPLMLYQIQTKYRDEIRPRAGIIRTREFLMKDGYSFHENKNCLKLYYNSIMKSYSKIFKYVGIKDVLIIESDVGIMHGDKSHEFIVQSKIGEDVIFKSSNNEYIASKDVATAAWNFKNNDILLLNKIKKDNLLKIKTIQDIASSLNVNINNICKSIYYIINNKKLILVLIRGDFEVNETKLKKYLNISKLQFATNKDIMKINFIFDCTSSTSVINNNIRVIIDYSVSKTSNLIIYSNQKNCYFENFNCKRDVNNYEEVEIASVRDGDPCPVTGTPLKMCKGIEIGNIFQLGQKYTKDLNCNFLDKNGCIKTPIMGCYGIGIGRLMAAVIEYSHDLDGPIWPITIAPYQVCLCVLNLKHNILMQNKISELYLKLKKNDIEVILEDRDEIASIIFKDADLMGVPFRIIISNKLLKYNSVEIINRNKNFIITVEYENIIDKIKLLIKEEFDKYDI